MSQRPRRVMRARIVRMTFVAIAVSTIALTAVGTVLPAGGLPAPAFGKSQMAEVRGAYDRAEADARATVDAARIQFGDGTLEVATACDDLLRALLLNGRGGTAETLSLAERTLEIKESLLGPAHPALASSLVNLGDALVAAGKYDRAITLLDRSVALRERDRPGTLDHADALDHLASALTAAGRYDAALSVLKRSLQTKETLLNPESMEIARTLRLIGFAFQRRGDYENATEPIRRAEQILRILDAKHPEYAETLNVMAQQLWFEGRLQDSRATSERALVLAEQTLRADHPTVARSLRLLAGTLADLGDFERSHELRERALAIVEREFGPGHYETAIYLNSAAMADLNLGAYPAARARFERAVDTFEAQFGPWHDYVATTRLNLALVDAYLGDYAKARREQARVTAIWERLFGRNHPFVAVALTELALVYREQGRHAEALPLLARSLAIRQRSLGAQHRDVALTRVALAATQLQLGQIASAQTQAASALTTWEQLDEPDAPDFATALALYAELQLRRGAIADARQYYEKALSIRAKVFGRTHPAFAEAQAGLALTQAVLGEFSSALGSAADAEQVSRNHLRLMLAHLPERQSLNYAASRPKGLDLVLSLVGSIPDAVTIGLEEAIRSRAMVLDEMAARRDDDHADREDTASLSANLAAARQRLANLLVRGPHEMPPARHAAIVEEARIESEVAEQKLAEQSLKFRAELNRINPGLQDVATTIPTDSALVSFVRYDRSVFRKPAAVPQSRVNAPPPVRELPSYIALVLRPGVPPAAVPLGSAATIDAHVSEWRQAIAATGGAAITSAEAATSSRISGTSLRRLVWDPLAINLRGAVRVFIVPDGSLNLVPFAALPIGGRSYLLETGPVIHYLSAERDLVAWSTPVSTDARGLLAIGAPSFNDGTLFRAAGQLPQSSNLATAPTALRGEPQICGGLQAITFPALAGTLREVRELSSLWNAQELSDRDSPAARTLVGREANEGAFKREAHRYRVLHLATHGFFVGSGCATPGRSGTRGVGGLSVGEKGMENPLLLSGLALAGANRRANARSDEEDGILTAEEVASLSLDGVEWAVLSACDTGVGEIRAGEGVLGLRRAFQIAGARTVVMSLWSVDDQAARGWMRALYEGRFQKRLSTAEAVHAASLKVLRDRRARGESTQPFYWAGFVASGDWR